MDKIQRLFHGLLAFGLITIGSEALGADHKNVAAGPQEIAGGHLRLPDPAKAVIGSHSIMLPITLQRNAAGGWQWQHTIAVDDATEVKIAVFSPSTNEWDWKIQSPNAAPVNVAPNKGPGLANPEDAMLALGNRRFPAKIVAIEHGHTGPWTIRIRAPRKTRTSGPDGYLLLGTRSPYRLNTQLLHYRLLVGQKIGLSANISHSDDPGKIIIDSITQARLRLHLPDGSTRMITMFDDGTHQDTVANDGSYATDFSAKQSGNYIAEVIVNGISKDGLAFERSSTHTFPVLDNTLDLDARAAITKQGDTDYRITLPIIGGKPSATMRVAAELWGLNPAGHEVAISWLGQMVTSDTAQEGQALELTLDAAWLVNSQTQGPLELRHVRVQDGKTHIPLIAVERMPIDSDTAIMPTDSNADNRRITSRMHMGRRPQEAAGYTTGPNTGLSSETSAINSLSTELAATNAGRLLLVHGYCSDGNVWPTTDFHDYAVFHDPDSNRSNDEFALLLREFGSQFPSFGIVGHSQGGNAALHLYTYYWSGLDNANGSRLIQSVGAPYRGTALAGNVALLGSIFGAGCGSNWDMSYDGAALWLSGIPNWARSQVYYWSTSFKDRRWRYDYCSLATDLLLKDPEDGVVERTAAQLSGANNMGHKTGWCHTTGMRDPAQYRDRTRNLDMDAFASR